MIQGISNCFLGDREEIFYPTGANWILIGFGFCLPLNQQWVYNSAYGGFLFVHFFYISELWQSTCHNGISAFLKKRYKKRRGVINHHFYIKNNLYITSVIVWVNAGGFLCKRSSVHNLLNVCSHHVSPSVFVYKRVWNTFHSTALTTWTAQVIEIAMNGLLGVYIYSSPS